MNTLLDFAIHWLRKTRKHSPVDFYSIASECFGVGWPDDFPEEHGCPTVICFRGQNYVPQKISPVVWLHNKLVDILNRRIADDRAVHSSR